MQAIKEVNGETVLLAMGRFNQSNAKLESKRASNPQMPANKQIIKTGWEGALDGEPLDWLLRAPRQSLSIILSSHTNP